MRAPIVYSDFSGDLGFKFGLTSSKYLVFVLIVFGEDLEGNRAAAEKIRTAISKFRQRHRLSPDYEFSFNKSHHWRIPFLEMLRKQRFEFRVATIDKRKITGRTRDEKIKKLCASAARLFKMKPAITHVRFYIDIIGSRKNTRSFLRRVKSNLPKNTFFKTKIWDSKHEDLLQVADAVSGSIYAKYEKGEEKYYKKIKGKGSVLEL